jgi:photosystem II stability/assembly factor-like uncharacterized protein
LYGSRIGGLWRTPDSGLTWTQALALSGFTAVTARDRHVHIAAYNPLTIWRSEDDGATWSRLPFPAETSANALLETRRGTILAATGAGIMRSADVGRTWATTGVLGQPVTSIAVSTRAALAALQDGSLWRSDDVGETWSRVTARSAGGTHLMLFDDTKLLASHSLAMSRSQDGGITWSPTGLEKEVTDLVSVGSRWFAATWDGVFRSDDLASWNECSDGLPSGSVQAMTSAPDGELIALVSGTLYRSQNGCRWWWPLGRVLPSRPGTSTQTTVPRTLLSTSPMGPVQPRVFSDPRIGIAVFGNGIQVVPQSEYLQHRSDAVITAAVRDSSGRYWVGTPDGVFELLVDGTTWTLAPTGLNGSVTALAVHPNGDLLAAVPTRGIFCGRLP